MVVVPLQTAQPRLEFKAHGRTSLQSHAGHRSWHGRPPLSPAPSTPTCFLHLPQLFGAVADAVRAHVASAPSHFRGEPLVFWKACEEPLKLRLQVSVTYSFTGEDVRRHLNVRTALLNVVRHELRAAGARYTVPSSASGVPAAFALPGAGV